MRNHRRLAVTLLELLLALTLMTLVMLAITIAINTALFTLNARRTGVEEAQLARAILTSIANDLRSAVAFRNTDFSGVSDLAAAGITGIDGNEQAGDIAEDEGIDEEDAESVQDIAATLNPASVPGVYGNRYQIQVDISRLPRIEEFEPALQISGGRSLDLPSDVKTVAYYLNSAADNDNRPIGSTAAMTGADRFSQSVGLVRRALDRSTTQWAVENGNVAMLESGGELLADEVRAIEFRYFDGQSWLDEWNSEQMGGLPMAVQVAIAVQTSTDENDEVVDSMPQTTELIMSNSATAEIAADTPRLNLPYLVFHQMVRIPAAQATFDEEAIETDEN